MRSSIKLISCGRLIDGSGNPPKKNREVLIEGSSIRAVAEEGELRAPAGTETIDASDKTVMPGLFDCHLHFYGMNTDNFLAAHFDSPGVTLIRSVASARRLLEAGYTTVRDCGGVNGLALRRAITEGSIEGPRILAAGFILTQTFGAGDVDYLPMDVVDYRRADRDFISETLICDGVTECIQSARYALRKGADFIKICASGGVLSKGNRPEHAQFTPEEIGAIVQEARHVGKFVAAHAMGTDGIRNAIACGVRTIDHAWYPDDECVRLAKEKGTIFVPTLSWDLQIIKRGEEGGYSTWAIEKEREAWKERVKRIRRAHRKGVTMASGTDFCDTPLTKMGENAMELEFLVRHCNFTPMEAIVAATANGAKACALENATGRIEAGKLADLLVVDGDPSKDIALLQHKERIQLVLKEGLTVVDRRPGTGLPAGS
jgi:imidazolonepropionase-like amidohydrolase